MQARTIDKTNHARERTRLEIQKYAYPIFLTKLFNRQTKEISIRTHWPAQSKTINRPTIKQGVNKSLKIQTIWRDKTYKWSMHTRRIHLNHHNSSIVNALISLVYSFQLPAKEAIIVSKTERPSLQNIQI